MNKILPVDKLEIGMEVVAVDKSWLETNILFHRFRVRSLEDIQRLRDNGIKNVTILIKDSMLAGTEKDAPLSVDDVRDIPKLRAMEVLSLPTLREWNALHDKTIAVLSKSFDDIRMGSALDVTPLRQQVIETLEMLVKDPRKNSFLVTLSEVDDESYVHSTNTMILSMGLAAQSGVPKEDIPKWGMAALLHDIGKALVPLEILKKAWTAGFSGMGHHEAAPQVRSLDSLKVQRRRRSRNLYHGGHGAPRKKGWRRISVWSGPSGP